MERDRGEWGRGRNVRKVDNLGVHCGNADSKVSSSRRNPGERDCGKTRNV